MLLSISIFLNLLSPVFIPLCLCSFLHLEVWLQSPCLLCMAIIRSPLCLLTAFSLQTHIFRCTVVRNRISSKITVFAAYRVSQEERSILWEVIVSVILSKNCICTCVLFWTVSEIELFHCTVPKLLIRKRYYKYISILVLKCKLFLCFTLSFPHYLFRLHIAILRCRPVNYCTAIILKIYV
jgi:hypothetical protein